MLLLTLHQSLFINSSMILWIFKAYFVLGWLPYCVPLRIPSGNDAWSSSVCGLAHSPWNPTHAPICSMPWYIRHGLGSSCWSTGAHWFSPLPPTSYAFSGWTQTCLQTENLKAHWLWTQVKVQVLFSLCSVSLLVKFVLLIYDNSISRSHSAHELLPQAHRQNTSLASSPSISSSSLDNVGIVLHSQR